MHRQRLASLAVVLVVSACTGGEANKDGGDSGNSASGTAAAAKMTPYKKVSGGAPLATVGGATVTEDELETQLNRLNLRSADEATLDKKREALDRLIEQELLYQEAKRMQLDEHPRVKLMMVSLLQREAIGAQGDVPVSDEELMGYYNEHKNEYVIPEKVRARRILIKAGAGAKEKVDEVMKAVKAHPDDFPKLAREHGQGPEAPRSGELGYFAATGRPGLDAAIVEAAFKLDSGAVAPAFETDEGWNIIKIESRSPRTERTFEQVKKSVERRLRAQKRRQVLDSYVDSLRKSADIEINEDKLAAFVPEIKEHEAFPQGLPPHITQMPGAPKLEFKPMGKNPHGGMLSDGAKGSR